MTDSSGAIERLGRVTAKQIQHLLAILSSVEMRKPPFIRRAYEEYAQHFDETLEFLTRMAWVTSGDADVRLTSGAAAACDALKDEERLRECILAALITTPSPYRLPTATYVRKFSLEGGRLKYRPALSDRLAEKPLRDFLMDLRTVDYRAPEDAYELSESAGPMYVWAHNLSRSRTRAAYQASEKRREELGYAAELVIVDYERKRLGADLADRVEHVSAEEPFACYDIKSVTAIQGAIVDRFIEVKAVPRESFQFYWSRAEMDAAQVLAGRYFLYLLPYSMRQGFDTEALLIVRDPHATLYPNRDEWEIEEDVIICRRRTNNP